MKTRTLIGFFFAAFFLYPFSSQAKNTHEKTIRIASLHLPKEGKCWTYSIKIRRWKVEKTKIHYTCIKQALHDVKIHIKIQTPNNPNLEKIVEICAYEGFKATTIAIAIKNPAPIISATTTCLIQKLQQAKILDIKIKVTPR